MEFDVDWSVSGSSVIEVTDAEISNAGIDPNDYPSDAKLFEALNRYYGGDLMDEVVSNFYTRNAPEITSIHVLD